MGPEKRCVDTRRDAKERRKGDAGIFPRHHKDLHVWREAVLLVVEVAVWEGRSPARGHGDRDEASTRVADPLWTQARAAAVAAAARIAEGHQTQQAGLFAWHLRAARGHLAELHTALSAAEQLGALSPDGLADLEDMLEGVTGPLSRLIDAVERRVP